MTPDHSSLEAELRDLQPAALNETFLARLESSAEGTWTSLTQREIRFEESLRATAPATLPADFLQHLESLVRDVPFPADKNIVPFPTISPAAPARRQRLNWAAAAAVALLGAVTALTIPLEKSPADHSRQIASSPAPAASLANGKFVPASFNSGVSEIHDEGVIWKSKTQPHRVVRVVYKDQVTLKDANGRTMQVEQPRVEYMLVPAKTD